MNEAPTIHELLRSRRSPRAFDEIYEVSRAEVMSLLEAARWSPSCFNEQPWHYIVCERSCDEPAWRGLLGCLAEANQRWAQRASVLVAVFVHVPEESTASNARLAFYDAGAASLSLCLQAHAQGLAAHQIGGFDPVRVKVLFDVSAQFEPLVIIAVGKAGDPGVLETRARERELAPRVRRATTEFVAFGRERRPF